MKKVIAVLALAVLTFVTPRAHAAGNVKAGLKAGVNFAKVTGTDATGAENLTGLVGGVFVGIKVATLVIQPEVLFSMKGTQINAEKLKLSYIEIPILLKMGFPSPKVSPNLFVGPDLGLMMSAKDVVGSDSTDVKSIMKSIDFGVVAGAGVDIKKISLDVRYTMGLSKIDNSSSALDLKNGVFSAMLGYSFL